jgi:hypothetical protein
MQSDTYALSLEIKLNDMASDALSQITKGIDNTLIKVIELESAFKEMSTNIAASFGDATTKINKSLTEIKIAHDQIAVKANEVNGVLSAGINTNISDLDKQKAATEQLAATSAQLNATEKKGQIAEVNSAKLDKSNTILEQAATKLGLINQDKLLKGEQKYITLSGITKGIYERVLKFGKGIGTALLAVATGGAGAAAGAAKTGVAVGAAGKGMEAVGKAAGGMGGGIDTFFRLSNAGMVVYGSVLVMIANALDNAASRAEKFKGAMFRASGSMNELMLRASQLTTGLKATSDEVDEVMTSLAKAGAKKKDIDALVESTTIFHKALGVSADTAAMFANRMRVIYGNTRMAEASMAMLHTAAVEFSLSGEDMTNIMQEATESATILGTYGTDSVTKYTETLVAAAAAAKALGVNTSKATQLVASMKEPLSYVKILGSSVLKMDPAQKMDAILKKIPDITKRYQTMIDKVGVGYATFDLKVATDLDPEQMKILEKMTETKKVMLDLGISTVNAEKSLEDIKSKAQESMTGVYTEMMKILDNIKNIGMMIFGPFLPLFKFIFQIVNGIFSVIGGFIAPIAQMVMKLFEVLDASKEINDMFMILRTVAVAIGKIFGFILFVVLAPIVAVVGLLVKGFKVLWAAFQPIVSLAVDFVSLLVDGVWDSAIGLIDVFNKFFDIIITGIKAFYNGVKSVLTLGGLIKIEWLTNTVKALGWLIAAIVAVIFWTKAATATGWLFLKAKGALATATKIYNWALKDSIITQKLSLFWENLRTVGFSKSLKALFACGAATKAGTLITKADIAMGVVGVNMHGTKILALEGETIAIGGNSVATGVNTTTSGWSVLGKKLFVLWEGIKKAAIWLLTWAFGANTTATIVNTAASWWNIVASKAIVLWAGIRKVATWLMTLATGASTAATVVNTATTGLNTIAVGANTAALGLQAAAAGTAAVATGGAAVATAGAGVAAASQASKLALLLPWLAKGAGYLAGYAWGLAGVVAGSAAFVTALTIAGVAIAAIVVGFLSYKFGKWISGFILSDEDVTKNHKNFLKVSEEIKQNKKEIDDIANKKIAALDAEGKKRADNLKLWSLNNTQAAIGAGNTKEELKMLESLTKAGKGNADIQARINAIKKDNPDLNAKEKQEMQAQDVTRILSLKEGKKLQAQIDARGHLETKNNPTMNEIPGVKIIEGGPATQNNKVSESTQENTAKLNEAVQILTQIFNNKKIIDILERYLPELSSEKGAPGLSSVANNWV